MIKMVMYITTEIRNYNGIKDELHFKRVREHTNDHTGVKSAFLFTGGKWVGVPGYLLRTLNPGGI